MTNGRYKLFRQRRNLVQIKYGTDDERTICLIKNGLSLSSAMLLIKKYGDHLQIDIPASTVVYGENLVAEMIKAEENQIQIYKIYNGSVFKTKI